MKRIGYVCIVMFCLSLLVAQVYAAELPESVQKQSRKDAIESETWQKFDQSGPVKFLQIQTTAAGSPAGTAGKLDGSLGETLLEVKVDPAIETEVVEWTLANKGPSAVWVVAASDEETTVPVEIAKDATLTIKTKLVEKYGYIVVDSQGGKTTLDITAKCGETDAKTTDGKAMQIVWF